MIHSMTAFARESVATPQGELTVELRSVNHRYLDASFRMPDELRGLEPELRARLGKALARGKVDCLVRLQAGSGGAAGLDLDPERVQRLAQLIVQLDRALPELRPPSPIEVLQFPGVCGSGGRFDEEFEARARDLFDAALATLCETRAREGDTLEQAVAGRLQRVAEVVAATRGRLPELMQRQRERILSRIAELDIEPDQNRLEQELVHLAQKADVDEELDRLEAHIGEVRRTLGRGGPCGRRLDFLMQELNREANTLSSKSFSASTTSDAVELKVLIEQMREQIQNIE